MLRAARGAITVPSDEAEDVLSQTAHLLDEMLARNDVRKNDIVSVLFTATPDLRAAFPAEESLRVIASSALFAQTRYEKFVPILRATVPSSSR